MVVCLFNSYGCVHKSALVLLQGGALYQHKHDYWEFTAEVCHRESSQDSCCAPQEWNTESDAGRLQSFFFLLTLTYNNIGWWWRGYCSRVRPLWVQWSTGPIWSMACYCKWKYTYSFFTVWLLHMLQNLDGGGSSVSVSNGKVISKPTCIDIHVICERAVSSIACMKQP